MIVEQQDMAKLSFSDEGECILSGNLTKDTIPKFEQTIDQLIEEQKVLHVVNLAQVARCDSALVALMIKIKRNYPVLQFQGVPKDLHDLFTVYGVVDLL